LDDRDANSIGVLTNTIAIRCDIHHERMYAPRVGELPGTDRLLSLYLSHAYSVAMITVNALLIRQLCYSTLPKERSLE